MTDSAGGTPPMQRRQAMPAPPGSDAAARPHRTAADTAPARITSSGDSAPPYAVAASPGFAAWLHAENAALAVTTYQIGKLFLRAGKADEAAKFLAAALEDDKARGAAHGYLAQIFARSGRLDEARLHLEQAHQAAPCWREPLEALAGLYRTLGEHRLAQTFAARLAEEHARQDSLSRRLAADA